MLIIFLIVLGSIIVAVLLLLVAQRYFLSEDQENKKAKDSKRFILIDSDDNTIESPTVLDIKRKINNMKSSEDFLILEGPVGYVQTALNDNSFHIEWNRGNLANHFTIDEKLNKEEVLAIFEAFLSNNFEKLEQYFWIKMEL